MLKRKLIILGVLMIALMTVLATWSGQRSQESSPSNFRKTASDRQPESKLTMKMMSRPSRISYAAIIYYAIHSVPIQRWQEVSDMRAGWQVELYHRNAETRYLVWPGKHISNREKQLAPNWFELNRQTVTYHSFEVHTDVQDEDQRVRIDKRRIVAKVNADHAGTTVRRMSRNMTIVVHRV